MTTNILLSVSIETAKALEEARNKLNLSSRQAILREAIDEWLQSRGFAVAKGQQARLGRPSLISQALEEIAREGEGKD